MEGNETFKRIVLRKLLRIELVIYSNLADDESLLKY